MLNRQQRRKLFKKNRALVPDWNTFNGGFPKQEPIISTKDKTRVGYKRRQEFRKTP